MEKKRLIVILIFVIIFVISILLSILYYKERKTVQFETGTEEIILTKYVNKNGKVEEPEMPTKEGYIFQEWELNGETYNFDTKVEEDIILTAKWVKKDYIIISFNTNSDYAIESKKIIKGYAIEDLPTLEKENYEFIGWYLNGELYDNEQIYSDTTLIAEYKNNKLNTTYKKGDKIEIIGSYSNSAYSLVGTNKIAIGWRREILDIVEESEFPYMIGNETGVTGFFKAESLKKYI